MENRYITVSALNKYIQYKFDNDIHLQNIYLKAELSNIRISKGIMYFVLKDDDSEIDGIMFQSNLFKLKFNPIDGMTVLVTGKVSVYQKRGRYSVAVIQMEEAGLGDAYLNFLRLKESLEKEGLFDTKYKKMVPRMSENIGVITSGTGDALHDITSTIQARFPLAHIYLYPALVQGSDAPKSLIKALKKANQDKIVDVIIIGRGGGSVEDLSCFNDEELARTIFASDIPVVSAVGHEADYTICDFVSSLRAPTPTGAAVLITREKNDISNEIINYQKQIVSLLKQKLIGVYNQYQSVINSYGYKNFDQIINKKEENLNYLVNHLTLVSPLKIIDKNVEKVNDLSLRLGLINIDQKIDNFSIKVDDLAIQMTKLITNNISGLDKLVEKDIDKLILLNPLNVMKKGYSLTFQDNKIIRTVDEIDINKNLVIQFAEGEAITKVIEVKK